MLTLLLVRHASHGLLDRVLAGRMPGVALSRAGREEAGRLGPLLAGRGVSRLLSSPVERARETAAAIGEGLGLPVAVEGALEEIDCGAWTGQGFDALADDPRWHVWNGARATSGCPGGETMAAVQDRVLGLVRDLAAAPGDATVAAVSHSDVIKAAVLWALGLPLDRYDRLVVDPASVTTLQIWRESARVLRLNEVAAP